MSEYAYGDYVAYDLGIGQVRVGRVAGRTRTGWHVCYHEGCTAVLTPRECLRPATAEEAARAAPGIGHHRFDAVCPDYDGDACRGCVHDAVRERVVRCGDCRHTRVRTTACGTTLLCGRQPHCVVESGGSCAWGEGRKDEHE